MTDTVRVYYNSLLELRERRDEDARETLREAADYISEHGWTQGSYRDAETGGVCALGAIWASQGSLADDEYVFNNQVCDAATMRLAKSLSGGPGVEHIPAWNDAPERTAEDVILALKRAAE